MHELTSHYVQTLIQNEPAFCLLRSKSAHLVISFLYENFRKTQKASIVTDELSSLFAVFLQEHLNEEIELADDVNGAENSKSDITELQKIYDIQTRAARYIRSWYSEEKQFLRQYYNERRISVVELNPSLERLFNFLEKIAQSADNFFVGTESRFQTILFQLRDLNTHINTSPETRIKELREEKRRIDEEIKKIEQTGRVETYTKVQINERLEDISRNSRELISEFRQVEENFRRILHGIYKQQSENTSTRGTILGYTLDTDKKLRESPQGQSFAAFWSFISQDSNNEINSMARNIAFRSEVNSSNYDFILGLKNLLYNSGHRIIEQNRSLADRLNMVLQQRQMTDQAQIANLTAEIKKLMHKFQDKVEQQKIDSETVQQQIENNFLSVETKPEIFFPQGYKVQLPKKIESFEEIILEEQTFDPRNFSELFNQFYIDEKQLLKRLSAFREKTNKMQFTLAELLEDSPLEKGLAELVAWYGLAVKQNEMTITDDAVDLIQFTKDDVVFKIKVPRIIIG